MEQILSQDEVDALLKGISGGNIEEPEDLIDAEGLGYTPYDFSRQERIVQIKMPALEFITDSFLRAIRTSLAKSLRRIIDIAAVPMELARFGAFVRTLPVPSSLQIFKMEPFRGHAMLVLEPKLVFTFVESFLGGSTGRTARIEGRDFTAIEQRLILRVVNLLLGDLEKAWDSLQPLKVQYLRNEINPKFAKICEPEEVVIINRFELDMDRPIGSLTICIPLANLELVKRKLMGSSQREQTDENLLQHRIITENIMDVPVDLTVELGKTFIPAGDILGLDQGDVIQLDRRQDDLLPAYVAGVRKYMGTPGIHRGSMAFRIRGRVGNQERD